MKVVWHEAKCMDLPPTLNTGIAEDVHKILTIDIVKEDRFSTVAPIQEMVYCPRILHSQLPRH
jgi:hypothetical protein